MMPSIKLLLIMDFWVVGLDISVLLLRSFGDNMGYQYLALWTLLLSLGNLLRSHRWRSMGLKLLINTIKWFVTN